MFDLFRSRDKAVRYLLGALLMLVALSMVVTLIPSYGSGSGTQGAVAEIGGDRITLREAQLALANLQRNRNVPREMMYIYVPQLVDQLITERIMAYEARRLGFEVTEEQTAEAIRDVIPQLFQDGKFIGRDVYAAFLNQQNTNIPEFEANMARQLLVNRLRGIVLSGVVVTPAEIEREYRRRAEKALIQYVRVSPEKFRSQVQVTPAEIETYYNANKSTFQTPEKRSLQILVIDPSKAGAEVAVGDEDLRRAYDANKDRFRSGERVKVRHILLTTTGKSAEEQAKIKTRAEDLLKQIKGGADFADLARKNSDDPGSAERGGDLDWVVRGQTVKTFEDAAYSLKPKQFSGVIQTEYGYHILQVMEKEEARLRPFEEARKELAEEARRERVNQKIESLMDSAQTAMRQNPPRLEEVTKQAGVLLVKAEKIGVGDSLPEIGPSPELQGAVGSLQKGEISQPVTIGGNRYAIALVTEVIAPQQSALQEVESQIRNVLTANKSNGLVGEKANELLEKTKAMDGDLKRAASAMGLEFKTSGDFTREGNIEGLGQGMQFPDVFAKPVGSLVGPMPIADSRVIAKILERKPADMAGLAAERSAIETELRQRKGRERIELFEDGLRQQLVQEGKVKIYQDVVKNLTSVYGS
ncbi:MAG: peptidyl-prolyl cis-trans isomerase [Bryobacteraceae bacterium]